MKKKKKFLFAKNLGFVLSALQFIVSVVFCWQLFRVNLLPDSYSVGISIILFLLCVITFLLQYRYKTGIVGKVIAVLLSAVLLFGSALLGDVANTIKKMTEGANSQTEKICVYIMADREIPSDWEAAEFTYGILASAHGESVDNMMDILSEKFGKSPKTVEYKTSEDLAEALYSGTVDAIILGDSFVPVITDIETYKNFETETRVLYSEEFSIAVEKKENTLNGDTVVVYLSGIDKFGEVSTVSRSDVNIIAVANLKTKEVLLINTPRDYFVNLKFSNGSYSSTPDKLTHAGLYGIDVSMNTLETIYDLEFDYYFRVNFTGFMKIIDALGGVEVYVPKTFTANGAYKTHFTKGWATLSGQEALDFVRERYAFADGDNQRGRDQMAVISAIIKKASSPAVISGYAEILDSLQRYFQTDMPAEVISEIVKMQLSDGGEWYVRSVSVSGSGASEIPYSMSTKQWVMLRNNADEAEVNALISQILDGESIREEDADE